MSAEKQDRIGQRIRRLRKSKNLSLRALGERAGLSATAIGRIERGESSPTVVTLQQLARALELPVIAFFKEGQEIFTLFVKREALHRCHAYGALVETLGQELPHQCLEPFIITLDPEERKISEAYIHTGEEFVYCLEGRVEYRVGNQLYPMESGDSLLFKGDQPHAFRNLGDSPARILVVIQETELAARHRTRRMHKQV